MNGGNRKHYAFITIRSVLGSLYYFYFTVEESSLIYIFLTLGNNILYIMSRISSSVGLLCYRFIDMV